MSRRTPGFPPVRRRGNTSHRAGPVKEKLAGSGRAAVDGRPERRLRARQYATELLGEKEYTLEEVEQDVYKGRRVWRITLGFPKRRVSAPDLMRAIGASLPLEYKTILVDIVTARTRCHEARKLMADLDDFDRNARRNDLLVDTNLPVLLIVGSVNRDRVSRFKRTADYLPAIGIF